MKAKITTNTKGSAKPIAIGDWLIIESPSGGRVWELHVVAQTGPGYVQLIHVSSTDANRNEYGTGAVPYKDYDDIGQEATEHLIGPRKWEHVNGITITVEK